jgi:hypothetical protein
MHPQMMSVGRRGKHRQLRKRVPWRGTAPASRTIWILVKMGATLLPFIHIRRHFVEQIGNPCHLYRSAPAPRTRRSRNVVASREAGRVRREGALHQSVFAIVPNVPNVPAS